MKHYSYRTEQTYIDWIKRYILFYKKRHPKDMGAPEILAFLDESLGFNYIHTYGISNDQYFPLIPGKGVVRNRFWLGHN